MQDLSQVPRGSARKQAKKDNRIRQGMDSIAATRDLNVDDVSQNQYLRLEAQAVANDAIRSTVPKVVLGGAAWLGANHLLNQNQGYEAVGIDPLAASRNSVANAGASLGSARMLEAMAKDEADLMQAQAEAMNTLDDGSAKAQVAGQFTADVTDLALILKAEPEVDASTAWNRAYEITTNEYRSRGIF